MSFTSGVYPVYNIGFKIGLKGLLSAIGDMVSIKDMESFSFKIDGKTEDWNPMDAGGWARHLMTSKDFTVSLKGKRSVGDTGNDYVAAVAWKDGLDCSSKFEIDFPDGSTLAFNCIIDVTSPGGGDSTNAASLEFDIKCDGRPTYTAGSVVVAVTGISLNKTTSSIAVGASDTLVTTITPSGATNKNVVWSTSDEAVATIDTTGKVTGVAAGTAIITAITEDGNKVANCTVTVTGE